MLKDECEAAVSALDEAERTVFTLKTTLMEMRVRQPYRMRERLTEPLAAVSSLHDRFKDLMGDLLDVTDTIQDIGA